MIWSSPRFSTLSVLGVALAVAVAMGAYTTPVLAAEHPAWQVSAESVPTNLAPGGVGEYLVHVRNIGTVPTDGSTVTVVDRLPLGVIATAAGSEIEEGEGIGSTYWMCSGVGTSVVMCTNNPENMAVVTPGSERTQGRREVPTAPLVAIDVSISPESVGGAGNLVSVSGGGAAEARSGEQTTISSASAGFGLASFEQLLLARSGAPEDRAGAHPYEFITTFTMNTAGRVHQEKVPASGEVKDLEVGLPPGVVGNPKATPKCARQSFDVGRKNGGLPNCAPDTQVGVVTVAVGYPFVQLVLPVYNLEPPADVPAQLGFAFQYRVGLIDAGVRDGEGDGLRVILKNIDQQAILRASLILWGVPADPGHDAERGYPVLNGTGGPVASDKPMVPFLTTPTSCHVMLASLVSADSWEQPSEPLAPFSYPFSPSPYPVTDNQGNQISMEGCQSLDFSPTASVAPASKTTASTPVGLDVGLHVPQNEKPEEEGHPQLAEAHLKDVAVTLPPGMAVSASAANGLQACTAAEIGLDNGNEPTCPDASRIGVVTTETPLLEQPLTGSLYVAKQGENPFGSLLAVYLTAEADGALIKLAGHVQADPTTGQLTTTFTENPQLPFSDLKVHLFSGPRAVLVTPVVCGSYAPSAQLTGWNETVVVPPLESFSVTTGCTHGFSPSFTAGTANNRGGGFAPFSATIARPDGDQTLGAVSVTTPPGLLGMLSRVPLCGEQDASQGACPEASLIGHTTATAGPGPYPVTVSGGRVYLTGPYKGAPFGLSIVVPAVAGPFNLGNVKVRAAIYVDPHTSRITVLSDPLPTIEQGIPLQIRTINVSVDRPGFIFNPTNCSPLSVDGAIASSEGAKAVVSSRFQAADCASLPFKPKFTVSTWGGTSKKLGASLDVKIASSSGQANIGKVFVSLPKQLPSRLTTLQQACPEATFAANPATCPAASVVGTAKAVTPVLNEAVSGPAYLVSHGGAAFPDLVVILEGQGIRLDLIGNTNIKKGITTSSFATVPDAPITSFELKLPQSTHSALTATLPASAHGSLCATTLVMPTTLTGQNGAQVTQSTKIAVLGCPKKAKARAKNAKTKPKRKR
jgi:uncharacterized repeat protein (TIGR01451 family)